MFCSSPFSNRMILIAVLVPFQAMALSLISQLEKACCNPYPCDISPTFRSSSSRIPSAPPPPFALLGLYVVPLRFLYREDSIFLFLNLVSTFSFLTFQRQNFFLLLFTRLTRTHVKIDCLPDETTPLSHVVPLFSPIGE